MAIRPYLNDDESRWLDRLLTGNESAEALSIRAKLIKAGYKQEQLTLSAMSLFDDGMPPASLHIGVIDKRGDALRLEHVMHKMVNDVHLSESDKEFYFEQTGLRI